MAQCMRHAPLDIFTPSCLDMHGEYILTLTWEHKHVAGHQDRGKNTQLDRWTSLNVEMDRKARYFTV
jgi:hypothetical protein